MASPSRITIARTRRGLTVTALAALLSVARQTVSAWEAGLQEPTADNLDALVHALGFPVAFFTASDIDPLPAGAVSFRAQSKTTKTVREAALSSGRLAMLISDWLDERYHLPTPSIPTLGLHDAEQAANMVRERWGLGQLPISNMVHLLESKGVRIFTLPVECTTVDAFCLSWQQRPVILLTRGKTAERRRFDLAHELGHLVLHSEQEHFAGPAAEEQANRFAGAFLMPRSGMLARPLRAATLDTVLRERLRWKVAAMALTHRLRELRFVSEWEYRQLCIELSRRGYRRSEPGGVEHELSQLFTKVLAGLRAKDSGHLAIAEATGLPRAEITSLLVGLAVIPVVLDEAHESHNETGARGQLRLA